MINNDNYSINLIPSEKRELLDNIRRHLEEQGIRIFRLDPWKDIFQIVIFLQGKKRHLFQLNGYEYYIKCGKEAYFKYIDQEIWNVLNEENLQYNLEKFTIMEFIESYNHLRLLNTYRSRNFILHRNKSMDLVYYIRNKELLFDSSVPFSNIEHDTNRKFTEKICIDLLLDFEKSKKKFIKLLSRPYDHKYTPMYEKFIDIINGNYESYTDDDILVMISILGRLSQEKQMGPISVRVDEKLNPKKVIQHDALKKYIISCLVTIKEYAQLYSLCSR